jgi:hypothetical protein
MNIAILSLYTQAHAPLNAITEPTKRQYAERWGHTFINHFGTLDESRPPAFSKIRLIQQHLKDFDWVYWIDADAAIMNPDIPLKTFLRDYDLVIAQEPKKSHYGDYQFNTGSFFLRNSPWSHQFLESTYEQDQFLDHIYWDQAAMRHVLESDPDSCRNVYIETNPKAFNSFAINYSKGDFVFHAVHFSTAVELKEELLRKMLEEDQKIPEQRQPDLDLLFLARRDDDTYQLVGEIALPSIVDNNYGGDDATTQVIDVTPSVLTVAKHGPSFGALMTRVIAIARALRGREGRHVAFALSDTQFLGSNWKRFILVQLGDGDGLFLENGAGRGRLGDAFFVVRVTASVIAYFEAAAEFLEGQMRTGDIGHPGSFAELIETVKPAEYGCVFKLFPEKEVQNIQSHPGGNEIMYLIVHSAECAPDLDRKRQSLVAIRDAYDKTLLAWRDLRINK